MVYRIKVIIIGEAGVGKTSLVKKFVSGRFTSDYRVSIGANLFVKDLILNSDIDVSIQIWDIAGQEKWVKMRHLYYKGAHGALIVGDLTRGNTFEQLKEFWALWNKDKMDHLSAVLELEKAAMRKGFPLTTGLVAGYCRLCEKCTLDRTTCTHPTKARISEEAVGVNVQATAKNAGMAFIYPFKKNPASFAIILID